VTADNYLSVCPRVIRILREIVLVRDGFRDLSNTTEVQLQRLSAVYEAHADAPDALLAASRLVLDADYNGRDLKLTLESLSP